MLKRLGEEKKVPGLRIADTDFPAPFYQGLEYSSPARGCWNIVHTGMLIPESHQIFVCAKGCLRGVVLTAAEAGQMDRYSAIEIREENVLDGNMEELMVEGVADVLSKLKKRPKAVLIFISCQHFFLAYDQEFVYESLRKRFPEIHFVDCYMIPTLRKSGLTPDQKMRIQIYRMLEPGDKKKQVVNLIGSNHPLRENGELMLHMRKCGLEVRSLNQTKSFEEYLSLSEAWGNIYYEPLAAMAAKDLQERLGQESFYLAATFSEKELKKEYREICHWLGIPELPSEKAQEAAEAKIRETKELLRECRIALDYTFTFRTLSFARLLLEHEFNLREIYLDSFLPEEKEDYLWIRENFPDLMILPTNQPEMRFVKGDREDWLAIGQKAAYFCGTDHFVNVAEAGGYFGFQGICDLMDLMQEAFREKKDRRSIIQRKGYGCESCL